MQINLNNQTTFSGKFSPATLAKFRESLTPGEFKQVKKFRAGKKYTNIDIITVQNPPERLSNGVVISTKETFAEFSNARNQNGIKGRVKLANGELPFNMETFKLITSDLVRCGEKLVERFK